MQLTIDIPDNLASDSSFDEMDWLREIAIALFQQERVSLGRASKIAGMHVMKFQKLLSEREICVHYDVEDLAQDMQLIQSRGWL